jgi:hemolysin III
MSLLAPTGREELANSVTHGIAALASLVVGSVLIVYATLTGDAWRIVSAVVFSLALVVLYTASTLYHSAPGGPTKSRLEIFDHCAIYLLIAGTYTPFTLVSLRGPWGWSLFGVIWALAIAGIAIKLLLGTRFDLLSTGVYIAMGWLIVVASVPMIQAVPQQSLWWLVAGGVAYTAGTAFYHNRRLPYAHAIWHLFVIAGSACHVLAICSQLIG